MIKEMLSYIKIMILCSDIYMIFCNKDSMLYVKVGNKVDSNLATILVKNTKFSRWYIKQFTKDGYIKDGNSNIININKIEYIDDNINFINGCYYKPYDIKKILNDYEYIKRDIKIKDLLEKV